MGANVTTWISSTEDNMWVEEDCSQVKSSKADLVTYPDGTDQTWQGVGACFNEHGWAALSSLGDAEQDKVLDAIYGEKSGCNFNYNRLPIGANDYSFCWHSLNETPDDFEMEHFSVERDQQYIIPFIKKAQAYQPEMVLFASPWSPPTWLKFPVAHNHGTVVWEEKYLKAYSLYFLKFVQAYAAEGIKINHIHIQNEPISDQKWPSCVWTGEQFRDFIRDYMGPMFEKEGIDCSVWAGTLESDDYNAWTNTIMADDEARKYVGGFGYQWQGRQTVKRAHDSWPDLPLIQTENQCHHGKNDWADAQDTFILIQQHVSSGVVVYEYWNPILLPKGLSTWGWSQNCMVTIDPESKQVSYNPEFYAMKHLSRYVRPGAVRIKMRGPLAGNMVAFRNPDDSEVYVVQNPLKNDRLMSLKVGDAQVEVMLKADSLNTFVV